MHMLPMLVLSLFLMFYSIFFMLSFFLSFTLFSIIKGHYQKSRTM